MWRSCWTCRRGEAAAVATATASGSDGSVRAVARERTRGKRESEGEGERCRAVRGVVQGVQGDEREKQEVARMRAGGERVPIVLLARGRGRLARPAGWAGLLGRWARPGKFLPFLVCFCFLMF